MQRIARSSMRWIAPVLVAAAMLAGFLLIQSVPVSARPAEIPPAQDGPPNAECLTCHSQPGMTMELPSGEPLDITIEPGLYGSSVHGQENISCVRCHSDITGYPHPENPTVEDRRDYTIMFRDSCRECHGDQYQAQLDGIHYETFLAGNKNTAFCSDCHDPHRHQVHDRETLEYRQQISETCARCHSGVYEEYMTGVHGVGLQAGSFDVPTCIDCHGVHDLPDPDTAQFRLTSVVMCADCHTDPVRMSKYGLSTAVLDTFVDDFHGTTITLFEAEHPDQYPNTPVCFDCHGVHNVIAINDPEEGLAVRENILTTCQKCHPDATANFPTSWLSHYIPNRERFPLVYWVTVFYRIFVPGVLGIMAVFVVADLGRRLINRSKGVPTQEGPVAAPEQDQPEDK